MSNLPSRRKRIRVLQRRLDYLHLQLKTRSYSVDSHAWLASEAEALAWAIETLSALIELRPVPYTEEMIT